MNRKNVLTIGIGAVVLEVLGVHGVSAQDKYTVKVPGGLAFSEFRVTRAGMLSPSVRTEACLS